MRNPFACIYTCMKNVCCLVAVCSSCEKQEYILLPDGWGKMKKNRKQKGQGEYMAYHIPESKWIWIGEDYDKKNPVVVYFRKELELESVPQRVVVRLSADSRYRFYVNGVSLCQGPCKGDRQVWYYDEVDLAPFLHIGKNILAAIVLRYPQLHSNGNFSVWRTETPGFYLDGALEWTSQEAEQNTSSERNSRDSERTKDKGRVEPIYTGKDWHWCLASQIKVSKSNPYFEPLCITEEVFGIVELAGWLLPDYREITYDKKERKGNGVKKEETGSQFIWQEAVPYPMLGEYLSPGRLDPRPIPFLYETRHSFQEVMCVREGKLTKGEWERWLEKDRLILPANSKEVVELHAGELTTGYLELAVAGGEGSRIRILCSESYVRMPELPPEVLAAWKAEAEKAEAATLKESLEEKMLQAISFMKPEKGNRLDWENGVLAESADQYTVGGYGTKERPEYYEPFWFRTFRFLKLEIETGEEPLELCSLTYRETGYPLEVKTTVETSDESLSEIWSICERTLRRCMHETYEDCPFYEQLQYIMDTRSQILFTYLTSADDRLARKCIEDFARSQRYDGLLEGCYPSYGSNLICNFSIYYILMVRDHFQYFGDVAFTKRFLPILERILQFFQSRLTEQGLVGRTSEGGQDGRYWSFIDWVDGWERGVPSAIESGEVTMESLLYCVGLQALADLERSVEEAIAIEETDAKEADTKETKTGQTERSRWVETPIQGTHPGRSERKADQKEQERIGSLAGYMGLAARHEKEAEVLKQNIRKACMEENGLLRDGPDVTAYSQHCQVFGTLAGVFTPEEAHRAMEAAMSGQVDGQAVPFAKCSVAMAYYLFRALEQVGLYEKTDELWENWRAMLRANLTTCVENDGIKGRSDCHAWGALALYELPAVILGVRPAKPGFAEIEIRPVSGYLSWAKGEVITPKGTVRVKWEKKEDGRMEVEADVPSGVKVKGSYF